MGFVHQRPQHLIFRFSNDNSTIHSLRNRYTTRNVLDGLISEEIQVKTKTND